MNKCVVLMLLAVAASFQLANTAHAQFDEATKWIPPSANSIVLVRAKEIFKSKKAQSERWSTERIKAFKSGAAFIPPVVERFLMAAQLDFEFMDPVWQVAIFENVAESPVNMVEVSKRVKGNLDTISGYEALVLPNDAYAVKINDLTLGAMVPANRQVTSRWLGNKRANANLSSYLDQAVKFADKNAHVIVAFDFKDAVSPKDLHEKILGSGLCKEDEVESFCSTLSAIRGVTLGITITDKITGALKVDFDGNPTALKPVAKDLLIKALGDNGLMIDDFDTWNAQVNDKQIRYSGSLTRIGMRQIGRLIEHPIANTFVADDPYLETEVDMKTRSKQYFNSIQEIGEEIQRKEAKALRTYARWFDKYAREIDSLPLLNVDPIMLDYGRYVADSFRDISYSLDSFNYQKVADRAGYEDRFGSFSNRFGYRTTYFEGNLRNRQKIAGQTRVQGANKAREIIREVDEATAKVRRDMTEKYEVEF